MEKERKKKEVVGSPQNLPGGHWGERLARFHKIFRFLAGTLRSGSRSLKGRARVVNTGTLSWYSSPILEVLTVPHPKTLFAPLGPCHTLSQSLRLILLPGQKAFA
jgi:hypothetical protein